MGEFGDQFRKAREQKKLSFDDVSRVIKISARMLKAIEEEHFEQLPGGVFNKGFVRTYAKHLGLSDDEAVDDYLKLIRKTQIEANELPQPEELEPSRPKAANQNKVVPLSKHASHSPVAVEELPDLQLPRLEYVSPAQKEFLRESRGIPWSLVALAAVIVSGATFLYLRHSRGNRAALQPSPIPATIQAQQPVPATPAPLNATPNSATSAAKTAIPAVPPASTKPASTKPTPTATSTSGATTPVADNAKPPTGVEPSSATTKSSGSLRLVIRATENSWLSVLADGQPVTQETLIAPAHTTIHANREIVARIGNAAGITFQWNGQEIAAQGLEGEAKTVVFDAQGMRVLGSTQPSAIP